MKNKILFLLVLYAAGTTGFILADRQGEVPEIVTSAVIENKYVSDEAALFDTHNLTGLQDALEFNKLDERAYRCSIYDCREFSAALEAYLTDYGFDCGICTLSYGDAGHRLVWVRMDDNTFFVEAQNDKIYSKESLRNDYPDTIKIKLHDYNIKVASDEVLYYEN